MPRKILISFLGTGRLSSKGSEREYATTKYSFGDKPIQETSITASALINFLSIDTLFLFGTMGSAWESAYVELAKFKKKEIDVAYSGKIFDACTQANKNTPLNPDLFTPIAQLIGHDSLCCAIKYGLNEDEIKDNFNIFAEALDNIKDGDEIYLDITYSFRSLPLFATTAISYIQDVSNKKAKLKGIYYGMFEAIENEIAPIVDLSYISQLQNWIKGAHSFMNYGNGHLISQLLKDNDEVTSNKITDFSNAISMNYMHEVKSQVNILTSLQKRTFDNHAQLVLPQVFKKFTKQFDKLSTVSEYQYALAKWHFDNKSYGESYLALIEALVTYVCEQENLSVTDSTSRSDVKGLILKEPKYAQIKSIYAPANEVRKSVAHIIENPSQKAKDDIRHLNSYLIAFKSILNL